MIECLIIGDSIAQGITPYFPECKSYTKIGISSYNFNNTYLRKLPESDTTIISFGSNPTRNLLLELLELRKTLKGKVIWIVPHIKQDYIKIISKEFNDTLVYFEAGKDKIHPKNIPALVKDIKELKDYLED